MNYDLWPVTHLIEATCKPCALAAVRQLSPSPLPLQTRQRQLYVCITNICNAFCIAPVPLQPSIGQYMFACEHVYTHQRAAADGIALPLQIPLSCSNHPLDSCSERLQCGGTGHLVHGAGPDTSCTLSQHCSATRSLACAREPSHQCALARQLACFYKAYDARYAHHTNAYCASQLQLHASFGVAPQRALCDACWMRCTSTSHNTTPTACKWSLVARLTSRLATSQEKAHVKDWSSVATQQLVNWSTHTCK
jgi:hypothetical protein